MDRDESDEIKATIGCASYSVICDGADALRHNASSMGHKIKFRMWLGGSLVYRENINYLYFIDNPRSSVEMLATGVKDKNGKEIYDGDIVKMGLYNDRLYIVKHGIFEDGSGDYPRPLCFNGFYVEEVKEGVPSCSSPSVTDFGTEGDSEYSEVLGNIYENPELLA